MRKSFSLVRLFVIFWSVVAVALLYPSAATESQRRAAESSYMEGLLARATDWTFIKRVFIAAIFFVLVTEVIMAPVFRQISKHGRNVEKSK